MKLRELLLPFGLAASVCWIALAILIVVRGEEVGTQLAWSSGVWALATTRFFGTALLVHALLQYRSGVTEAEQPRVLLRLFLGLGLKLACFGLLGVVVWAGREKAEFGILIATLTLLLVPVGGGFVFYRQSIAKKVTQV